MCALRDADCRPGGLPRGVCGPRKGEDGSRASVGGRAVHDGAPRTTFHRVFGMHVEARSVRSPSPQRRAEETSSRVIGGSGHPRTASPSQAISSCDIHGRDRCWIDGASSSTSPRRLAGAGQPRSGVLGSADSRAEGDVCGLFGVLLSRSPSEDHFVGNRRGKPDAPKAAGVADLFATGPVTRTRSPSPQRPRSPCREVSPRDHFRFENCARDEVAGVLSSSSPRRRQERPDWQGGGFVGRGAVAVSQPSSQRYDVDNFRQIKVFPDSRHYQSSSVLRPGSPGAFDETVPKSGDQALDHWGSPRGGRTRRSPSPCTRDSTQGALTFSPPKPDSAESAHRERMTCMQAPSKESFKNITPVTAKRKVPVPGEPDAHGSPAVVCENDAPLSWGGAAIECSAAGASSPRSAAAARAPRESGMAFRSLSSHQFKVSSKQGSRRLYPNERIAAASRAASAATAMKRIPLSAGMPAFSPSSWKGLSLDTTAAGTSAPSEPSVADECLFGDRRRKTGGSPFASPGSSPVSTPRRGSSPPVSPRSNHQSASSASFAECVSFGWSALPHSPAGSRSASPARAASNGGESPRLLPQDRSLPWLEDRLRPRVKSSSPGRKQSAAEKQQSAAENAKRWK